MKPTLYGNISPFAYIGLMVLFLLPEVGVIFSVLFAIFARDKAVKSFSIAFVIISVLFNFGLAWLSSSGAFNFEIDYGYFVPDPDSESVSFAVTRLFDLFVR